MKNHNVADIAIMLLILKFAIVGDRITIHIFRPSHVIKDIMKHIVKKQCSSDMAANKWDKCPATTNAVERKNDDSKGSLRIDQKEALVRVYRIDKAFCLQYIAAEEGVRIRCWDSSYEVQAACCQEETAVQ